MNVFLTDLFLKIANKLGFEMQEKQYVENDFFITTDLSITSVMSDRLSTLTIGDSSVQVDGKGPYQILLEFAKRYFNTRLKKAVVTCLGTGDCLIIPITDGKMFDVDIIGNNEFAIIDSVGDVIKSVVIKRDEFKKNNKVYERYECHGLEIVDGITWCRIYRYGFIDGKEIGLSTVPEWASLSDETWIPNVDRLLLGRYKCPTINRSNINSAQGVPITYGLDKAVKKAKESYEMFNEEYRRKQTKVFARKDLFTKDIDKGIVIPDKAIYQMVGGDMEGSLPIQEYSPDLRYDGLSGGVDFNFKMLELFCGLSAGVLTDIQSDLATATAIRASMNNTFAFISTMRKVIEQGTDDLINAVAILYNANNNVAIRSVETSYDWDYSMMENSTETFQQYLQSFAIGEIGKGEVRSWLKNIPLSQAKEELAEMEVE